MYSDDYGFGMSSSQMNYFVNTNASHKFYTGAPNNEGTLCMTIANGNTTIAGNLTVTGTIASGGGGGGVGTIVSSKKTTLTEYMGTSTYNICNISLTSGTWLVTIIAQYTRVDTGQTIVSAISTSTSVFPTFDATANTGVLAHVTGGPDKTLTWSEHVPCVIVVASTTTYYFITKRLVSGGDTPRLLANSGLKAVKIA